MCIYYTVYRTINLINNKEYIGIHRTENPNDLYLGSGETLKKAIRQYGKENFKKEILFIFDNPEEMIAKEAELVNEEYVKRENTYNLVSGGISKAYYSEETRRKISQSNIGKTVIITEETKQKIGKANKGKIKSEACRAKLRESRRNFIFSDEHRQKISDYHKNKSKSVDTKYKMSVSAKEVWNNRYNKHCPYCNYKGSLKLLSRYHLEKCKHKDVIGLDPYAYIFFGISSYHVHSFDDILNLLRPCGQDLMDQASFPFELNTCS